MASCFLTSHFLLLACILAASQLSPVHAGLRVWGFRGGGLSGDPTTPPDPYIKVWYGSSFSGMTEFLKDVSSPIWTAEFNFPSAVAGGTIYVEVWDKDLMYDDKLGICQTTAKKGSYTIKCQINAGYVTFDYEMF